MSRAIVSEYVSPLPNVAQPHAHSLLHSFTPSLLHSFLYSLLHSLLHSPLHSTHSYAAETECTPWSKCGQGEQFSPGSLAADSTCSPCPAGSASGERHREREKFAYTVLNSLHFSHPDSNSMLPCCSPQERTRIPSHTRPQHAWIVTLGSSATRGQHVCSTHAQHHQSNALPLPLNKKKEKQNNHGTMAGGLRAPLFTAVTSRLCLCGTLHCRVHRMEHVRGGRAACSRDNNRGQNLPTVPCWSVL